MLDYGLQVSQNGYDVKSATLQQIAFNSKYPLFKVLFSGSISFTAAATSTSSGQKTNSGFNHNLGYIPAFLCIGFNDSAQTKKQPLDFTSFFGLANNNYISVRCDTNTLRIQAVNFNTTTFLVNVYYYIFSDPGT